FSVLSRLVLTLSLLQCVTSYRLYQANIPNGDAVPHPCKANAIWQGVGHFLDEGTGFRNPFGADFEKEGHIWTTALCQKDSDGDGKTNGQELGDPSCVWTKGTVPSHTTGLSHPGVCEPWDSPKCFSKEVASPKYRTQEEWMKDMCRAKEFVCAGLNESDVRNMSLRLLNGKVPAKETTYMCQIFDFEAMAPPGDYHLIAVEPILDNRYVIHHIILFGCHGIVICTFETPYECGMVASRFCYDFLNIWTVGLAGECYHPQTGIRIGTKGYARMALQLHWNNPQNKSDWTDTSGLKLFYTENRRRFDAANFITGLDEFVLPPGRQSIKVSSTCTSTCSQQSVTRQAWVTKAWNHMHYAGEKIKMSVELVRNGKSVRFLTNDVTYSYDSPRVWFEDNPVQLLPGDELITTCDAAPFECGMLASSKCMKILSIWTVGMPGDCFHPNTGIRIGANGYKRMALQLHWNNPEERSDLTDSSGLILHFTPNLRQYEAAFLTTGLYKFIIPPEREAFQLKSTCTSACTHTSFKGQAWVTSAWNHMHYAGRKMSIELIRNNRSIRFLTNDEQYSYDSPQISYYTDNPIQLLPGDELVTRCEYSTLNRSTSTRWGEATNDEMCFGFLTFYPKENISNVLCLSGGPDIR
ncbi:unnamed protein product, partial [Lymnaea stagnalis]